MSLASIDSERMEALVEQLRTLEQDLRSLDPCRRQKVAGQVDSIRARLLSLLADLLAAEDSATRRAAAYGLSKLEDPRCVPLLVSALSDPDEGVRVWAVEGLSSCDSDVALLPLVHALCDESVYVYYSACNALKYMGRADIWPLIEDKLSAGDVTFKKRAAKLVGDMGEDRALPKLIALACDPDCGVRYEAVEALRKIGDPAAFDALVACLEDDSRDVRIAAIQALRLMGDTRAVKPLVAICIENEELRIPALQALREIAGDEGVAPVLRAFGKTHELVRSTVDQVMDIIAKSHTEVVS